MQISNVSADEKKLDCRLERTIDFFTPKASVNITLKT